MTGRSFARLGIFPGVFSPLSISGLALNETTIAEHLKARAAAPYRTGMIGKWHLGVANGHHPVHRGFDFYVGLPYSDDMGCGATPTAVMAPLNQERTIFCPACQIDGQPAPKCAADPSCGRPNGCFAENLGVPLFQNETIVAQPVDLGKVSGAYKEAASAFLENAAASGQPVMILQRTFFD